MILYSFARLKFSFIVMILYSIATFTFSFIAKNLGMYKHFQITIQKMTKDKIIQRYRLSQYLVYIQKPFPIKNLILLYFL